MRAVACSAHCAASASHAYGLAIFGRELVLQPRFVRRPGLRLGIALIWGEAGLVMPRPAGFDGGGGADGASLSRVG